MKHTLRNILWVPSILTALLLAPLAMLHAAETQVPASKPNIIFIRTDDLIASRPVAAKVIYPFSCMTLVGKLGGRA